MLPGILPRFAFPTASLLPKAIRPFIPIGTSIPSVRTPSTLGAGRFERSALPAMVFAKLGFQGMAVTPGIGNLWTMPARTQLTSRSGLSAANTRFVAGGTPDLQPNSRGSHLPDVMLGATSGSFRFASDILVHSVPSAMAKSPSIMLSRSHNPGASLATVAAVSGFGASAATASRGAGFGGAHLSASSPFGAISRSYQRPSATSAMASLGHLGSSKFQTNRARLGAASGLGARVVVGGFSVPVSNHWSKPKLGFGVE